jgi:hypothetical protein
MRFGGGRGFGKEERDERRCKSVGLNLQMCESRMMTFGEAGTEFKYSHQTMLGWDLEFFFSFFSSLVVRLVQQNNRLPASCGSRVMVMRENGRQGFLLCSQ